MAEQFVPFEIDVEAILAIEDPQQREAALHQVQQIKAQVDANPLWRFRPHEGEHERVLSKGGRLTGEESRGQVEYLELNQREVYIGAVVAGNRFGKTQIGAVDNLIQILPPQFVPPWLEIYRKNPYNGDYRCRSVVVDLSNALKKVWLPKLRRLIPPQALWKGDFAKAWNDRDRLLQFADGSWWDFLTHDMDVDAFAGADLDRIHFDEEPPGAKGALQFDESSWRLIDRNGDFRFTMTPLLGFSWVYYELTREDVPRKDDEVYVVEGSIDDNPTLTEKTLQRQIKRYEDKDPAKLEARRHGRFVHFAGLIYDSFREAAPANGGHIVPRRAIPRKNPESLPTVPIYCSIDPGVDHPAALVYFWLDENDVAEVFYAQKWSQGDAADLAAAYHEVNSTLNFSPRWTVIDPVAQNRNFATGRNLQDHLLREHKIHTIKGQNAVGAGINEVKARLNTGRLVIHSDLDALIDEFRTYRWKTDKGQTEDDKRLEPIKKNDDLLDALRYGLMSLPMKAKREIEEEQIPEETRILREHLARMRRSKRVRVGASRP